MHPVEQPQDGVRVSLAVSTNDNREIEPLIANAPLPAAPPPKGVGSNDNPFGSESLEVPLLMSRLNPKLCLQPHPTLMHLASMLHSIIGLVQTSRHPAIRM